MMNSIIPKKNKKRDERKVHFAEHEDVFVLPLMGEDSVADLTAAISDLNTDNSSLLGPVTAAVADEIDADDEISLTEQGEEDDEDEDDLNNSDEEDSDDEDSSETELEEECSYEDTVLGNQSRMRKAVRYWTYTPYPVLIEDAVEEEGEAEGVQKYITTFVRIEENGDCLRGLERQICFKHNEARKNLIENAMHAVLLNDFRLRYEEKNLTEDEIWKELRNISKKQSRGSHAFARKMGKADEAAVHRGSLGKDVVLEHIEEMKERRKNGTTARRSSDGSTPDSSSPTSRDSDSKKKTKSRSSSSSTPEQLSRRSSSSSTAKKDKKDTKSGDKKERKTPMRISSMSLKRGYLSSNSASKDKKTRDLKKSNNDKEGTKTAQSKVLGVDLLFHDVDKRGKTKVGSRWKSLKKRLSSSSSHGGKRSQ
jgi:hypothetical protein